MKTKFTNFFTYFFSLLVVLTLSLGNAWGTEYSGTVTFYTTSSKLTTSSITNSNPSVTFTYSDLSANGSSTKICNVSSRYGIKGKNAKLITVTCPDGYYFKSAQFALASFGSSETPRAQVISGSTALYTCSAHKYTKIDASDCGDIFSCEDSISGFVASKYTTLTVKEIGNSKNLGVTYLSYTIAPAGGGTPTHSVSAVTSTGTDTYGTVSAAAATVAEGGTVLITATPVSGYRVSNWAVSGTGATIDPLGSSNSNTTTLTMGTADATVTATFEAIPTHSIVYTNTKEMDNSANPTSYYEGVGVASFTKLRHAVGYDFTSWSPYTISSSATTNQTIEAQWSANAVAEGSGSLTYALAFGSGTITTSSITRVNGALYDATDVSVAHTSFDDNTNKNGCSGKLHTTSAKDDANYVELTFKVADGYTFTPTEVSVRANAVSTAKTLEVELKDNAATPNSKSVTGALDAGSTDGGATVTLDFDASGEVALEGTVTAKIFVYGATNAWRLGTSIVITGTMASTAAPSGYAITTSTTNGTIAVTDGSSAISSADEDDVVYIAATPDTGYGFSSWDIYKTSDATTKVSLLPDVDSDNKTRKFSMPAYAVTVGATFTAINYTVTLENGETDGAATVHYGDAALTITTAVSGEEGDVLSGFYTAASEGTKVAEADGTLVASVTGYTDENGKWIKEASATLYAIWIPYVPSSDATLSDLTVGGTTVTGFAAATTSYNVELPFGTTSAPTVDGTANDAKAKSVVVTQASSANGDATVVVTAEDNSTKTYTVHFSVAASKDIRMVWKITGNPCGETSAPAAIVLSTDDAIKDYLSISFEQTTSDNSKKAEEKSGSYLSTGKSVGNLVKITAKPGFAFKNMSFYGKIESSEVKCPVSIDGGETWTDVVGSLGSDAQHCDVFTNAEAHEIILKNNAGAGTWIRHMDLTMIQSCSPKTIAWTTEPAAEYEVGATGLAIAASANNGTVSYAASNAAITVNASTGALTISSLTNDIDLSASVAGGDGTTYCTEPASVVKEEIKTYYLVTFDAQNETAATPVKYYSGDAAIALPSPSYSGHAFQGWFDAPSGGNEITSAITPSASMTVYAQWVAQCAGPTITTQPASANYFVGRTAAALTCAATPGVEGKALTYTWYSCADAERTSPVELAGAPTPSTAAVGTFYYYCAVTEADCDVVRNSNVATVTVTEKDMLLLIQANHVKGGTANMSGYIGGTYRKNMQDNSKFGSKGHYFGIKLASGTFQAGDRVYVHTAAGADTNGDMVRIFKSNVASAENVLVAGPDAMVSPNGDNWVTLPATTLDSLYLRRGTDAENYNKDWNPYIDIFAVYRAYPVPVVAAMTVNGSAASIAGTNITATIAANAELASVTLAPTFMSNDPTLTNGVLGDWSEVSTGVYTASYVVTDKDGDTNTYLITLTRDVAITSITISGETSVAEDAQITLTATVLPANVSNKEVTWTSSDETKAVVDANGVVTGKAAGAVTITATSVADNTKFGTYNITVTGYVGTKRVYWFAYAADATANGVTNNSTVFGSAPTGSNSGAKIVTLEEGWVVNTTKYAGGPGSTGTFVVPEGYTATFYAAVKGSGSSGRYVQLKQGDAIKYTSDEFGSADPQVVKIDGVAAGTYTIAYVGGMSNFYLYAAELNRYAITSVTLESGFLLRTEDSRTPAMTIVHAKAAIISQTWSILTSSATGTTINASTGAISAGTTPGTITVQVVVEDAMGNEVTSNTCTVEIVEMFERIDVTGSMTWNWNELSMSNVNVSTERGLALANYIDGEKWKMLNGTNGDYAYRTEASGCYEALNGSSSLSFHTTVPGVVKITGRRRSENAVVKINGEITVGTVTSSIQTFAGICVAPGEVTITPDANGMRITKIEFDTNLVPSEAEESTLGGYEREVNPQYYGTICLPKAGVMTGALLFQIAYMDYKEDGVTPYKVYYDQVENGIMQAGMPYIFLAEQSTIGVYYTGTTAVAQEDLLTYHGLHGTLVDMVDMSGTGIYMLYNNKVLHSTNPASYLNANRAYIQISEIPGYNNPGYMAPAPKIRRISTSFSGTNVATGLDQISQEPRANNQKLLINGQLFILRGEKKYDATGRLVK